MKRLLVPAAFLVAFSALAGCAANEQSALPDQQEKKTITMSVDTFYFTPTEIRLKKGEKAEVKLTGVTGKHSFWSQDLALNVPVESGQTVTFDIPTDKAGTFEFRCGIPCGPGHKDMVGKVVIEE